MVKRTKQLSFTSTYALGRGDTARKFEALLHYDQTKNVLITIKELKINFYKNCQNKNPPTNFQKCSFMLYIEPDPNAEYKYPIVVPQDQYAPIDFFEDAEKIVFGDIFAIKDDNYSMQSRKFRYLKLNKGVSLCLSGEFIYDHDENGVDLDSSSTIEFLITYLEEQL